MPAREPLLYPGRLIESPTLLGDARLLELGVADARLGAWSVLPHGEEDHPSGLRLPSPPGARGDPMSGSSRAIPSALGARGDPMSGSSRAIPSALGARGDPMSGSSRAVALDVVLEELGLPLTGDRYPVLAVGSNAAPGQLSHKLLRRGLSDAVPMVPVRVRGVAVALSGHISAAGYVSASPVLAPKAETPLVATWLDAAQLAAVDETEVHYERAFLPGDAFPMKLPSGRRLGGAYLYCHARGVLSAPGGSGPRQPAGDQSAVLAGLLADSPRLKELLGPSPADWVRRVRQNRSLAARGTDLFEAEGWLLPERGFAPYVVGPGEEVRYRNLVS